MSSVEREFGGLDFLVHGVAFAPREELSARVRQHLARRLPDRARRQRLFADCAHARCGAADGARGGGSIVTLTYLGSERVFENYNVMGVAKAALEASACATSPAISGPQNIRVNAISAGPIKTLAASGIGGFSKILQVYRERAPLRRNVETGEVADTARFLLGPAGRGITGSVVPVDGGFNIMGF